MPVLVARTPWQAQLLLTALIWGSSFLCIKLAGDDLPPVWIAFGRNVLGATALLAIVLIRGTGLPRGRDTWRKLAIAAVLLNTMPFVLIAYGETKTSSILAGIWNATTPLLTLLVVMAAFPEEHPTRQRVAGLLVGFAGVLVVLGPWAGLGGAELTGQLCYLGAAMFYAIGFPFSRRHLAGRPESAASLMSGQVLCGAAFTALALPFTQAPDFGSIDADTIGGMLAIGALGTGLAYILNFNVVRLAGATTAATVTYVVPLFSTALGIIVLGEHLRWNEPVGAAIVLAGVALGTRGAPKSG